LTRMVPRSNIHPVDWSNFAAIFIGSLALALSATLAVIELRRYYLPLMMLCEVEHLIPIDWPTPRVGILLRFSFVNTASTCRTIYSVRFSMSPGRKIHLTRGKVDHTTNIAHYYSEGIKGSIYAIQEPECMRTPLDVLPRRSESKLAVIEVCPEEEDMLSKIKGSKGLTLTISAIDVKGNEMATTSIDWGTVLGAPNPFTKT
jgi:hypothetical protein